jgi:hypothetical protein
MKRNAIAILTASIILASILAPAFFVQNAKAADPSEWYITKDGVLSSDYYSLYPFEAKSLKIGFSKFGELMGIPAGADQSVQANWVGLEYDGRDPFCPPTVVPMTSWINGWYIDIQYIDPALSGAKRDRHLWAFAMFADGFGWGGDWIRTANPGDAPHGGRKTNGYCSTEPLKVLYNGPRLFVAESVTHIYDVEGTSQWPVLDVVIKLVFEKVKKEVILFKDLKITLPKMHLWGKLNVQFSNREEYDLGPAPSYDSYADFYPRTGETCYGPEWHLAENILCDTVDYAVGDGETTTFTLTNIPVQGFIKIWIDGNFVDPSKYKVDWATGTVRFATAPAKDAEIKFLYKYVDSKADLAHYDIAQVISSDKKYVAWTAFWPPVSDWTVDGILRYLDPLLMVREDDIQTAEPKQSPLIIGEWDILLDHETVPQFRCVEVKGVANRHDAIDEEFGEPAIDREVWYQLDEVFKPWDLVGSVHKATWRYVEFFTADGTWSSKELKYTPIRLEGKEWYEYCSFAERVLVDGLLLTPTDARIWDGRKWSWWPSFPYTYYIEGNTIYFLKDADGIITTQGEIEWTVEKGKVVKVLYSAAEITPGRYEWVIVGRDAATVDSAGAALVTSAFKDKIIESMGTAGAYIGLAGADMKAKAVYDEMPWVMSKFGTGNDKADYKDAIGRAALKDDWCTTWPVASSNMIGVGGPLANILAYYGNDFTPAFYGLPEYASTAWADTIIALSCWSQNTYASNEETGYAVVATYKDLNGTVLFLIWGHWGRDTYYATKWFHEKGVYILQDFPPCATAIILKIYYTVHEPAVRIAEVLGTISEYIVHPDP